MTVVKATALPPSNTSRSPIDAPAGLPSGWRTVVAPVDVGTCTFVHVPATGSYAPSTVSSPVGVTYPPSWLSPATNTVPSPATSVNTPLRPGVQAKDGGSARATAGCPDGVVVRAAA